MEAVVMMGWVYKKYGKGDVENIVDNTSAKNKQATFY